jgi:hypothetical protein
MDYDVVLHARNVHDLSESVCKIFRKIGKQKFIESYKKGIDRGDEIALLVSVRVNYYVSEKRELTLNLLIWPDYSTIKTADAIAIDVIHRVGRREPLAADKILQPLVIDNSEDYSQYDLAVSYLPDSKLYDVSWDEFHGWHGTEGYVLSRIIARALISPVTLPPSIPKIMNEIRMCYAFGQTIAVHGLCRTLIETALTDVCLRIGVLLEAQVKSDYFFKDFPPQKRIRWTLRGRLQSEALELYGVTSRVVHGSERPADTDTVIQNTIELVERLYAEHASKLQPPAKSTAER